GTNTGTFFSTTTDTGSEAINLREAINRSVSEVTATSSGVGVTVTANTAGTTGNSIGTTTTGSLNFSWGGTTLTRGVNAQPSILAMNQLYAGAATAASGTGIFSASPTTITGGQTITISSLTLIASTPQAATGSITIATNYCPKNGNGVTINGVSLTTTAVAATGSINFSSQPSASSTVTIGGPSGSQTYRFVSSLTGCSAND